MTRRGWAVAIFAAWAASLAWLVKREFFRTTGERLAEAALAVPPGTEFYRVDLGGQQVGFASSTVDTLGTTLRVTDLLLLDLPVQGRWHHSRVRSIAVVNRALRLETLQADFEGDGGRFGAYAVVSGDSVLTLTLASGSDSQTARTRLAQPVVVPSLLPVRLAFGGALKPGRTFALRVFDPLELGERDVQVTIAAESTLVVPDSAVFDSTAMAWTAAHLDTVRAFKISQRMQGLTTSAWIDAQGRTVRATGPVGLTMERAAYEIAYQNFRHRDTTRLLRQGTTPGPGAIVSATAIAAGASLAATGRDELRVRLGGIDPSGLELTGGRQRAEHPDPGARDRGRRARSRGRRGAPDALGGDARAQADRRRRPERGARARPGTRRLQRADGAVRGAGARRGAPGPARRRTRGIGGALLLSRVARGVSRGLGRRGPHARSVPGGRGAPAVPRGRGGAGVAGGAGPLRRAIEARGPMIRLENLTKLYGSFVAVDDITLRVGRGELFGFLGPNGAGKTTTLRMIAGILRPSAGRILIGDDDVHQSPLAAKQQLGFIPDRPFVYEKLTGAEFLRFVAGLYGQEGESIERRIAELLEVFELTSWRDELVEAYSHGMRQKLIISSALIHRPACIVVDEPMVGLDPKAARLLKDIFRQFVGRGGTVLMSTHTLEVAEAMCDRIAIIQHGKIAACGTMEELRRQTSAGNVSLEELFLRLTGGVQVRELAEVLGDSR